MALRSMVRHLPVGVPDERGDFVLLPAGVFEEVAPTEGFTPPFLFVTPLLPPRWLRGLRPVPPPCGG